MSLPGCLIPIGGAEDKRGPRTVLEHFVRLSGGEQARLAVVPAASGIPDSVGQAYHTLFTNLGATSVEIVEIKERADANQPARGVQIHFLTRGYRYDLAKHQAIPPG